ncbi:MAG: Na/Pi cotransporter family protein [Candidatus Omnitrophota bacterium]|nr:MAG: Na/Pi cotransporter family protein [Candidatus Omnitrophota bacterium]
MFEIIGYLIGGIGVFFVGMSLLGHALKQMTGRKLRMLLAKWAGNGYKAGLIGYVAGAVTQSMSALSFIIASLVGVGVISVRQALPVILWANTGVGLLVLLAFLNINILILFVLGIAGISYSFGKSSRINELSKALFGLGLLFFGLSMIKQGAAPLSDTEWFKFLLIQSHHSYVLSFVVGALLSFIAQTSSAVSILAITLTLSGLFSVDQTIIIIYGTNFGSSISTTILASQLKGTPKQLVMAQVFFNVVAAIILVPLFILETFAGIPLVKALVFQLSDQLEQQMAFVYIIYNLTGSLALSFAVGPYARFLDRCWPPTREEEWSQIKYMHDHAPIEADIALRSLDQEQLRLIQRFPIYMEELRNCNANACQATLDSLHNAFASVSKEIEAVISDLTKNELSHEISERILCTQNRQNHLGSLDALIYDFSTLLAGWSNSPSAERFRGLFIESIDTILLTACDTCESNDADDIDMLISITSDRNELMQTMRRTFLAEKEMSPEDRMSFLQITSLFERVVWILGRIGFLQRQMAELNRADNV